jgi:cell division protein FtsW (lipid II flippase)
VVVAARLFSNFANRVQIWLDPFSQAIYTRTYGGSYQVVQGLFGMATGGLMGTGLGHGHPSITPFANSDFIYASLGEEVGLTGLIAILVLYLIIIGAGFITAMKIKDGFGKLLVSGLVFSMAFQVFVVVGGITLVIPLTGLTLPYIAAGGSSLIANWLLATLVLIISNAANKVENDDGMSDTTFRVEAVKALKAKEA